MPLLDAINKAFEPLLAEMLRRQVGFFLPELLQEVELKKAKEKKRHITREYHNGYIALIAHLPGGRGLSNAFPPVSRLRWAVRFAFVDFDVPLVEGDEQFLYQEAERAGMPIDRDGARSLLLQLRLSMAASGKP